ncbi:MAG: SDR family oxidoreductase [Alphaproteobacteria bacterium]|nr:SDR family oxidoreductase [Alphaproteobacteria bacterium]
MAYQAFDLSGKVALVTGGNSGIGLGFAEAMAQAGADVCIWGTNADKNAAALEQLQSHGGKATAQICDVSDQGAVTASFAETLAHFGRVDSCFANAGVSGRAANATFMEMPAEEWRRVMDVNLDGAFFTLQAAARHMTEREGGGRLIGTASLAAIEASPRSVHYAATKGALISMMISLSVGLARYGITANSVLPGWIETPMTAPAFGWDKFADAVKPRIPARRWGTKEDFGGVAVYLASDASAYHSGDTFIIDGAYNKF